MNRLALGLFIVAALLFAAFHGLPFVFGDEANGWMLWVLILEVARNPSLIDGNMIGIAIGSFVTQAVIISSSPFLSGIYSRARPAWWVVMLTAGISMFGVCAFLGMLVWHDPELAGPGMIVLFLAPIVHFCGMLLVRGGREEAEG